MPRAWSLVAVGVLGVILLLRVPAIRRRWVPWSADYRLEHSIFAGHYDDGYREGRESALRDLSTGKTNYISHSISPSGYIDGVLVIDLGCVVIGKAQGFQDGYNTCVASALKKSPPNF